MSKKNKIDADKLKFTSFKQQPNESIESLDIRFTEILNELDSLGVPAEMFTTSDNALAIIRSMNSDWSTEKATYQTQNSHDTSTYVYILERAWPAPIV